jgi:hypothetical protein
MKFQNKINQLVALFNENVLDAIAFKNAVQNTINQYNFVEVEIEYSINEYQFAVEKVGQCTIVTTYRDGLKFFTRIFDQTAHETHIYNYCRKFAVCPHYRHKRMVNHCSLN